MVQIMAWRRPGDKPLSEPMVVTLPTHIIIVRPQWVNGIVLSILFTASPIYSYLEFISIFIMIVLSPPPNLGIETFMFWKGHRFIEIFVIDCNGSYFIESSDMWRISSLVAPEDVTWQNFLKMTFPFQCAQQALCVANTPDRWHSHARIQECSFGNSVKWTLLLTPQFMKTPHLYC